MINKDPLWVIILRAVGLTLWMLITLFPLYWILLT